MNKKILIVLALLISALTISGTKNTNKKIWGEWVNPNNYVSTGELKGFNLLKGGKCKAINVPALKLDSWEVIGDSLFTRGTYTYEGVEEEYFSREKIARLTKDSLVLVSRSGGNKAAFIYVRPDFCKNNFIIEK